MAPPKFGSVRHKAKSTGAARLTAFRDDTGLVALRYEQTKQAEPPIPLPPPRNPRRLARPPSTITSSSATASTTATAPTSPIVVSPPPVAPPQEQHPLFRAQRPSRQSSSHADERKRDSGAPTSSSVTLREEYAEELNTKLLDDISDTPSVYSTDREIADHPLAPRPLTVSIPPRAESSTGTAVSSPTQTAAQQPMSPTRRTSLVKKLSKSFGIGADGSKKLRKKMLGSDRAASPQGAPPEAEAGRGSPKSPKSPKSPRFSPHETGPGPSNVSADRGDPQNPLSSATTATNNNNSFAPITTQIPDDNLWDDLGAVSFSKRGSIMFGGKNDPFKSPAPDSEDEQHATVATTATTTTTTTSPSDPASSTQVATVAAPEPETRKTDKTSKTSKTDPMAEKKKPSAAPQTDAPSVPSIRVSSMDVERESQKVRSLYESGEGLKWEDGGCVSFAERLEPTAEVLSEEEENVVSSLPSDPPSASAPAQGDLLNPTPATSTPRSANSLSPLRDSQVRASGAIEDWDDLEGVEVDRYGFITPKRPASRAGTAELRSSQFSPMKRNVLTKRPSTSYSSSLPGGFIRPPSRKVSARSLNTFTSELSTVSRRSTRSSIRSATNRLPHNRDRRWMDEAAEMLSLQAGLTGITDEDKMGKTVEAQKRKEAERSEKWRKMATAIKPTTREQHLPLPLPPLQSPQGQGMSYAFDTTSPKLIERVWKGIPDCWRSAAWYSFLATSAAKHPHAHETEDYLIAEFRRLQAVASPDDVQIDLDVPRTVNGHIMFRRRYRGGQRLLFRLLHAISLYFPGVGYVQGMASLAATLLCYFDEERAFVMLVRLWRYRGLEGLYKPGFAGLMAALAEFEGRWLAGAGREVKAKLNELGIDATAYGTRWYLTLFNLSIPFPAQLRVWDVFMLLGDCPPEAAAAAASSSSPATPTTTTTTITTGDDALLAQKPGAEKAPKGLDVLHATSAALIHALRDVLLDSDFENAMKALTAWIPVRDEDLLMKVARAEWRRHQGRAKLWEWEWEAGRDKGKDKEGKDKKEKEKEKEKMKEKEKEAKEKEKEAKEKEKMDAKEKKEKEKERKEREKREKEREKKEGKEKGKDKSKA